MSNAIIGSKTQMQIDVGGTLTTIAEVLTITALSLTTESISKTSMDSTDHFMDYIPGFRDGGEVSFDVNYIFDAVTHDGDTGLLQDFADLETSVRDWRIIFPEGSIWEFSGFVSGFTLNDPVEAVITASITIKVTGKPEFS